MSRVEELPDDFDDKLDLNKAPGIGGADNQGDSMDDLFDRAMARGGFTDRTFEEVMSDMSKHPLFMNSLDEAGDDRAFDSLLFICKVAETLDSGSQEHARGHQRDSV